jgi:hypothetical protein
MILKVQNFETNTWLTFDKIDYVEIQEPITYVKKKKEKIKNFMRFKSTDFNHKKIMDYKSFVNFILFNPLSEKTSFLTQVTMFRRDQESECVVFSGHGFLMNDNGKIIQSFYNFKY